jgi:Tol biopolymer transport system component
MSLSPGQRLGPHEILSSIGAGGMGEVYQARDTRLDRTVAIKVLPAEFSRDAALKIRFEREAKTISALNHPNICTLHDIGHESGVDYLVMEYIEGETLADRLKKGPLPIEQVLRSGVQIATALEAAHRQGIVHRDLKPGNVMLTKSGAKLLDFGLAKSASASSIVIDGATEARPLTREGTILGTFQYMAPEQLEGQEADARTDIFALGAVLFEMATGRRAFEGQSKTSLIAAIVSSQPAPVSSVTPMAPPALDHIIKRCLEKNPDDRWQSARDVAGELQWIGEAGSQAGVAAPITMRRKTRERLAWSLAGVAMLAAAVLGGLVLGRDEVRPMYVGIAPPEGIRLPLVDGAPANAVPSPDGTKVVYRGAGPDDRATLYLHQLATGEVRALPESADAQYPFWSPDSRWVAFFTQADSAMKKIDTAGGPPVRVVGTINGKGGTWNAAGQIVFARDYGSPLSVVPAAGGDARDITKLDLKLHNSHRHPRFLPDGRQFLFLARSIQAGRENSIMLGSLEGTEPREILRSATQAEYADGHLLFLRGQTLMAQRFDPKKGTLEGEARPLAEGVMAFKGASYAAIAAARKGLLAYHTGVAEPPQPLEWRDRKSGAPAGFIGEPAGFRNVSLAPSGRSITAAVSVDGETDIWVMETAGGQGRRLRSMGEDLSPYWSLDEKTVVYSSNPKGRFGLYRRALDGAERVDPILETQDDLFPMGFLKDGSLLLSRTGARGGGEVRTSIDLLKPGEKDLTTVIDDGFAAVVSPDSRWIAWSVVVGDRTDLFIAAWPEITGRRQLMNGVTSFFWSPDSRELIVGDQKDQRFSVDVAGGTFAISKPVPASGLPLAVSPDGQKILTIANPAEKLTSTVRMIQNWEN